MTDAYNPLRNAFELQRSTIQQSQAVFEQMTEFQRELGEAMISGTEATGQIGVQSLQSGGKAMQKSMDAVESKTGDVENPITQLRQTMLDQFEQLEAQHHDAMMMAEEGVSEGADAPEAMFEALEDQLDFLLEAHELTEQRTMESLEQIESQVEQLQHDDRLDDLRERIHTLQKELDSGPGSTAVVPDREQVPTGERTEPVVQERDDQADEGDSEQAAGSDRSEADEDPDRHPLETIDGLGDTYAERLEAAGIESIETLSQTDSTEVADAAEISEERAAEWITAAQDEL